jgi:hypothetical protein
MRRVSPRLVRQQQLIEQSRRLTALACSTSGQRPLLIIGSFLLNNGFPLRK